jgi:hypothetical protein
MAGVENLCDENSKKLHIAGNDVSGADQSRDADGNCIVDQCVSTLGQIFLAQTSEAALILV